VLAGTTNGYRVYTTDPFNKQSESREGDVSSLEMLFSTSLVALTLSPRVLRIQNTKVLHPPPPPRFRSITNPAKRHSTICEMTFRTAILAMRLNRKRLVVVLESELYIYDISNMQMLKTEKTSPNPNGSYVILPLHTKLTSRSNLRSLRVFREQLSRISSAYKSRTDYLPTALACATQAGPCRSD
jgi:hypothetical protein